MSTSSRGLRHQRTLLWHGIYLAVILLLAARVLMPPARPRMIALSAPLVVPLIPSYGDKMVTLSAGKMTIAEFAKQLTSQTGVPVRAKWMTFPPRQYDSDTTDIFIPRGGTMSLAETRNLIPAQTNGDLLIEFEVDQIVIGPDEAIHAAARCETIVYPVGDFLEIDDPEGPEGTAEARMLALSALIQNTVDPGTWRDQGGVGGTIHSVADTLTVTTTPSSQYKVAALLAALRAAK